MAILFPALFKNACWRWMPFVLVILNFIYGISYDSFTALVLGAFYMLLFLSPGYRFFMQVVSIFLIVFAVTFIYLQPNLSLVANRYNPYDQLAISDVIRSHPLLSIDGNSTWRLVLWNQIIVDNFPGNLFGLGFGTPVLKYYPVQDAST